MFSQVRSACGSVLQRRPVLKSEKRQKGVCRPKVGLREGSPTSLDVGARRFSTLTTKKIKGRNQRIQVSLQNKRGGEGFLLKSGRR